MKEGLRIVESVTGYWHFHLAPREEHWKALCGARTMLANDGMIWGWLGPAHFPKKYTYCKECGKKGNAEETKT